MNDRLIVVALLSALLVAEEKIKRAEQLRYVNALIAFAAVDCTTTLRTHSSSYLILKRQRISEEIGEGGGGITRRMGMHCSGIEGREERQRSEGEWRIEE